MTEQPLPLPAQQTAGLLGRTLTWLQDLQTFYQPHHARAQPLIAALALLLTIIVPGTLLRLAAQGLAPTREWTLQSYPSPFPGSAMCGWGFQSMICESQGSAQPLSGAVEHTQASRAAHPGQPRCRALTGSAASQELAAIVALTPRR